MDGFIIPPKLFEISKKVAFSKRFIKKFKIRIKQATKKMKQLFKLKSKSPHSSRASYEGACVCNETYISETR